LPGVGDLEQEPLELLDGLAAIRPTELLAGNRPLDDAELPQDSAIPAGILGRLTIALGRQSQESDIDTDRLAGPRQRFRLLDLAREGDEPVASPAVDPRRLDRAFETAMPPDRDATDPGELEATAIDLEAVAVLLEAEPGKTVAALEPRIARILAILDPAE